MTRGRPNASRKFQSTHSLRSATVAQQETRIKELVSIHALLAECDSPPSRTEASAPSFNPRTPCGVRPAGMPSSAAFRRFQSTHSLRSATCGNPHGVLDAPVSIHALLAECDSDEAGGEPKSPVSIHALLAECDPRGNLHDFHTGVSIHALLAECDEMAVWQWLGGSSFNPRTPCGVRLPSWLMMT